MEDFSMKAGFARLADSQPDKRHITVQLCTRPHLKKIKISVTTISIFPYKYTNQTGWLVAKPFYEHVDFDSNSRYQQTDILIGFRNGKKLPWTVHSDFKQTICLHIIPNNCCHSHHILLLSTYFTVFKKVIFPG